MKRIILFVITNIAVLMTLGLLFNIVCAFFGTSLEAVLGPDWTTLAIFAVIYGFLGSIVSLLLSKPMAKMSMRAKTIDGSEGEAERWLVQTVAELARQANLKTPEVAVYPGAANAFATGAFRNSALVAVSTDIMGQMTRTELKAVLGHEMSHVANGDMVTMSLLQGVLNVFAIFFAHVLARALSSAGKERRTSGSSYYFLSRIFQMVLSVAGAVVVMAYSRRREYAADKGSARLLGSPMPMIAALQRLGNLRPGVLPDSLRAMGIAAAGDRIASLFASHPPLEDRVAALQKLTPTDLM